MPGRKFNSSEYRYGFNGKEKDQNGEFGSITTYDYGFRIYNPAIGKFLSVDPLGRSFPWNSSYAFAENDVISSIDLEGLERVRVTVCDDECGTETEIEILVLPENGIDYIQHHKAYIQPGFSPGKLEADFDYISNGTEGTMISRLGKVMARDHKEKLSDPQIKDDFEDAVTGFEALPGMGAFSSAKRFENVATMRVDGDIVASGLNPSKKWKSKIFGKAQKTGKDKGHRVASLKEAVKQAKKTTVDKVFLDRGWSTITGGLMKSRRRPDVAIKNKNGTFDAIEIPSVTDQIGKLIDRNRKAMNMLPKKNRGKVKIIHQNRKKPFKNNGG